MDKRRRLTWVLVGEALGLLVLLIVLALMLLRQLNQSIEEKNAMDLETGSSRIPSKYDPNFAYRYVPYPGEIEIVQDLEAASVNVKGKTALDGMSQEQVAEYRQKKVEQYRMLNFFRPGYDPLQYNSRRIYASISPGAKWLGPTAYYVANPYLPVIATVADHVTPLNLICRGANIVYANGRITETHAAANAGCWLHWIYDAEYNKHPGQVWLISVNAYDAGFYYLHVDRSQSINVAGEPDPRNIVNAIYVQSYVYHFGHMGANNISPSDKRSWITLERREALTRIYVKLWRRLPRTLSQAADLVYEIVVNPHP